MKNLVENQIRMESTMEHFLRPRSARIPQYATAGDLVRLPFNPKQKANLTLRLFVSVFPLFSRRTTLRKHLYTIFPANRRGNLRRASQVWPCLARQKREVRHSEARGDGREALRLRGGRERLRGRGEEAPGP